MKKLITLLMLVCALEAFSQSVGDYQSRYTDYAFYRDWNSATSWQVWNGVGWDNASSAPISTTNVTIRSGSVIAFDSNAEANNVTIQADGYLFFVDVEGDLMVTIYGNIVNSGTFMCDFKNSYDPFTSPVNARSVLAIYGSVTNSGLFDLYSWGSSGRECYADLFVAGNTNTSFTTNSGSTTNLLSLFLWKDAKEHELNFVYNGGTLQGQNDAQYGFLYMYEENDPIGTFRLSGSGAFNYFLFNVDGAEYGIGENCKFILDNPNAAIGGNGLFANKTAPFKLKGDMYIKRANIMYIGNNTEATIRYNDFAMFGNSSFTMESGQLGVLGAFIDSSCTACTYNQTGGDVFVGVKQGKYPSRGSFDLREASFNMSGGYINLVNAGAFSPDYRVDDINPNITGGFLQTGCGSSPNVTINWEIRGTVPGLLTYKNGTKIGNVILWGNTTAYHTTNIKAGTGFQFDNNAGGNYTYTQKGDSLLLYGDFYGDLINSKLVFNGSNKQYFYSAGGYYDPGLWELEINNSNDVVLAGGNTEVGVNLRLSNGKFYTGNNFIVMGTGATSTRTNGWVIGYIKKYFSIGPQPPFIFAYGTENGYSPSEITFGNVTVSGYLASTVVNANHPTPLPTDSTKTIKRYWDLDTTGSTIAFNNYTAKFTYLKEDFNLFNDYPNEAYMDWGKYSSSWIFPTVASRDTANNHATLSGLTTFSTFTAMLIPPKVTQEPQDSLICAGNEVKFGLLADTGTAPLTYQWQVNKNDGGGFVDLVNGGANPQYAGVTNDTLTISQSITAIDSFLYRCIVYGLTTPNDTSVVVTLRVDSAIATPNALVATNISTEGFTANWNKVLQATEYLITIATDSLFGDSIILNNQSTGTDTTYNASGLNDNTNYWYRVVAKNHCNVVSQISDSIKLTTLTGCTPVSVITEPTDPTAVCGGTNSIIIPFEVMGSSDFDYQWQVYNTGSSTWENLLNVAPYSSAVKLASSSSKDTLIITNVNDTYNGKKYRCVISNCTGANKDTTNEVTITVNTPITVNAGIDKTICSGTSTTLKAMGATSYAWTGGGMLDSLVVSPIVATTYIVTGTSGACQDIDTVVVSVDSLITVNAGIDKTICSGTSTTLKATGATSYVWTGGGTLDSLIVSPIVATTYIVTGTKGACQDIDTVVVIVDSPITIDAGTNVTICSGDSVKLKATNAMSYLWSNGLAVDSIWVNPATHTTYIVTGTKGACQDIDTVIVNVDSPITIDAGTDVTICSGDSVNLKAKNANNYLWSNGLTVDSIWVNPAIAITYIVTGTSGACQDIDTVVVKVDNPITVDAGNDITICGGDSVNLKATNAMSYLWSNGLAVDSIWVNPIVPTTYIVTGTKGACQDIDTVIVNVDSPITIDAGTDVTICSGDSVNLKAKNANNYLWSNGLTVDSIWVNPAIAITYIVTGTSGACQDIDTVVVKVDNPITVDAGNDITVCNTRDTINLKVSGATSYLWSDGSADSSILVKPTDSVNIYIVTGTSGACQDIDTVIISIAIPSVAADSILRSKNYTFCPNTIDTLTIAGGFLGYNAVWIWYKNNDSIATGDTLIATFDSTTIIKVAAVGTCDATSSVSKTINVYEASITPDSITADTSALVCPGENVLLTISGGYLGDGAMWYWYDDSTFINPALYDNVSTIWTVNPDSTKSYWVRAEGICNNTISKKITIIINGTKSVIADSIVSSLNNVCPNTNITFSAVGGGLGTGSVWEWYTDTILKSNIDTFLNFKANSNTTIYLRAKGQCGITSSISKTINVKTLPEKPSSSYATHPQLAVIVDEYCINNTPDSLILVYTGGELGTGGIANWYVKNPNETLIGSGNNLKVLAPTADLKYYVRFEADCGISDFDSTSIIVKPIPVVSTSDHTICQNEQLSIHITGNADSYLWSNGLGSNDTVSVTPSNNSTYYITASLGGCNIIDSVIVTTNSLPTVNASENIEICFGDSVNISVGNIGDSTSYFWDNGIGNTSFSKVKPTVTTTYKVTGTRNGCSASDHTIVYVYDIPMINLVKDTAICGGTNVSLSLNNTYTYTWSNGSDSANIVLAPTNSTKYYVTVNSTHNCSNIDSINVSVHPIIADFTVDSLEGFEPLSVVFTDNSSFAVNYLWDFGDGNTSSSVNPSYKYIEQGDYIVVLTVQNSLACSDTATVTIKVKKKPFVLKIPNVITPNGDMINDYFRIEGDGISNCHIKIFNRWGAYVTEITDCKYGWDGTINGKEVASGVYYYTITLTTDSGEVQEHKGFIQLIR